MDMDLSIGVWIWATWNLMLAVVNPGRVPSPGTEPPRLPRRQEKPPAGGRRERRRCPRQPHRSLSRRNQRHDKHNGAKEGTKEKQQHSRA